MDKKRENLNLTEEKVKHNSVKKVTPTETKET